jgi:hypothetical protein
MLSRRQLLAAGGASLALAFARRAAAIGPHSRFRFGQLTLGNWNPHPQALRRMGWEIEKRTSIDIDIDPRPVALSAPDLHETPLLYLAGDREFALPSGREIEALRRFLTFGGMLIVDSAEGRTEGAFDRSVRRLLGAVYPSPQATFQLVPRGHVLFKSFYLIERPVGRIAVSPILEGITRDDRLVVVYTQNDLTGAWARDDFGNWVLRCEPDGERQRELAFRLGINLVMYALCLEYKEDQVHVPFIMRRRQWRPDGPTPPDDVP